MSTDPSKRLRFGTTKSRNGCLPCKAGRVKCGEEKPVCARCRRKGRDCHWIASPTQRTLPDTQLQRSISPLPDLNSRDRTALEYFIARTSKQLIGTWGASTWSPTLMQIVISDPAVQRVSIALGALNHVHDFGQGSQQYGLSQYGAALSLVRDGIGKLREASESLLLACTLFCAFECMNYHIDSAMSHLRSTLTLAAMQEPSACKGNSLVALLMPVLTSLDNDCMCLGARSSRMSDTIDFDVEATFKSSSHAQQSLTQVLNLSHRQLAAVAAGHPPHNHDIALERVQRWTDAFDRWVLASINTATDEDITTMLSMAAWRMIMEIVQSADHTQGAMAWDLFLLQFERIVETAELFVDLTADIVSENELWKHPIAYVQQTVHERSQQTLAIEHGGQITEGSLAELLLSRTTYPGLEDPTTGTSQDGGDGSVIKLLQRARHIAGTSGKAGRAKRAIQGDIQIRAVFTLSPGIVYPLFAVVCHCREPRVRQRALRLLEVCNRHEGLWDSQLTSQSLARRVMVEESQAMQETRSRATSSPCDVAHITSQRQIPNHCRVRATSKRFLSDGTVLERFCLGWKGSLRDALASGQKERWIELRVVS